MTKSIDEWAAAKCGVEFKQTWKGRVWYLNGKLHENDEWTIKDPRCREKVRDHFNICTVKHTSTKPNRNWQSNSFLNVDFIAEFGSTIAEAEIACITAIYEAEK